MVRLRIMRMILARNDIMSMVNYNPFLFVSLIIIIIILFITSNWVDTRWQESLFTYYIIYARTMKVDYLRVQVWRATCEACSGNLEVSGTIPAFAQV